MNYEETNEETNEELPQTTRDAPISLFPVFTEDCEDPLPPGSCVLFQ